MKRNFLITLGLVAMLTVTQSSCGGSGTALILLGITPAGPTVVFKGQTLQFSTNPAGLAVDWSVVGGDANGTIDPNGLYTAPDTLPVDSTVSVMATFGTDTAQATVDLRTGETLTSFSEEGPINQTGIPGLVLASWLTKFLPNDLLVAQDGSLLLAATWAGPNGAVADVFFGRSQDLAPFLPEVNLTMNNALSDFPSSIDVDDALNPSILFVDGNEDAFLLRGSNQGESFSSPVPIPTSALNGDVQQGSLRVDDQGVMHLGLTESTGLLDPEFQASYTQSRDGGATWDTPVPIDPPAAGEFQGFLFVAVAAGGMDVHLCYEQGPNPGPKGQVMYVHSSDGGASFSNPIPLNPMDDAFGCQVNLGPNGEIYISYSRGPSMDSENYLRKSTNGGTSFAPEVLINSESPNVDTGLPKLSVDDLGRIDAIWAADLNMAGFGQQLMYARSTDGGATFTPNETLVENTAGQFTLPHGIDHDASGRLHITYISDEDDPAMSGSIYYILGE